MYSVAQMFIVHVISKEIYVKMYAVYYEDHMFKSYNHN